MKTFYYYENCVGQWCSWIFDPNSSEKKIIQWAKTFVNHQFKEDALDRLDTDPACDEDMFVEMKES